MKRETKTSQEGMDDLGKTWREAQMSIVGVCAQKKQDGYVIVRVGWLVIYD
jgi:hypothetical protein